MEFVDPIGDRDGDETRKRFRMRSSDDVDWNDVAKRYSDLVYSIARRRGLRGDEVHDVYETTWITALEKAEVPEDEGMAPWLAAIACWKVLSVRAGRRRHAQVEDFADQLDDGGRDEPRRVLETVEEDQIVRDAFAKLPPRDRLLLEEHYSLEPRFTPAQLADELDVAESSLSQLRKRAIEKLSKLVHAAAA